MMSPAATEYGKVTRERIATLSGERVSMCFQCQKCTNGCPLTFAMDIVPHRLVHSIQLGLIEEVLDSNTIWVCSSCETCTSRCPNDIDIAHLMDSLRQISAKRGVKESQRQVPVFHSAFLSSVRRFGRMHEASMALAYAYRSGGLKGVRGQLNLGIEMFRRGKIRPVPERLTAGKQVKDIFRRFEKGDRA